MVEAACPFADPAKHKVSIRRADYWLVEGPKATAIRRQRGVSIRRADYWLVEAATNVVNVHKVHLFQSAGRIIGWLKQAQE